MLSLQNQEQQAYLLSPLLFNIVLEVLDTDKKNK